MCVFEENSTEDESHHVEVEALLQLTFALASVTDAAATPPGDDRPPEGASDSACTYHIIGVYLEDGGGRHIGPFSDECQLIECGGQSRNTERV